MPRYRKFDRCRDKVYFIFSRNNSSFSREKRRAHEMSLDFSRRTLHETRKNAVVSKRFYYIRSVVLQSPDSSLRLSVENARVFHIRLCFPRPLSFFLQAQQGGITRTTTSRPIPRAQQPENRGGWNSQGPTATECAFACLWKAGRSRWGRPLPVLLVVFRIRSVSSSRARCRKHVFMGRYFLIVSHVIGLMWKLMFDSRLIFSLFSCHSFSLSCGVWNVLWRFPVGKNQYKKQRKRRVYNRCVRKTFVFLGQ